VYSNNPNILDKLKQSTYETITCVEVSELELVSNNLFKRLELCLRAGGDILNIYCDGKSLKLFIYFHKCTYMFIMPGILATT
jgi:hypothetical protein